MSDIKTSIGSSNTEALSISQKKEKEASIAQILTSQRDRYKTRYEEALKNATELSSRLADLNAQIEQLRQENIAMYEKIRYQENYQTRMSQPVLFPVT
jgi:homeobox protein cut-like